MNRYKLIKISVLLIDISFLLLGILAVSLPFTVRWYVETMGRSETLATTIFVTCYPCVPFAFGCLLALRRILKATMKRALFSFYSIRQLRNLAVCCIIISVITLIAGKFYLPFLIVGGTFLFLSLICFAFRSVIVYEVNSKDEKPTV